MDVEPIAVELSTTGPKPRAFRAESTWKIAAAAGLLLSSVAGCADTPATAPASAPEWQSGSRLRARVLDAGSGARSFEEWVDTTTKQSCVFTSAADGVPRCLPALKDGIAFEDAACEQPVQVVVPNGEANVEWLTFDFLGADSNDVCPTWPIRAGRVTHPSSATTFYTRTFGGGCVPTALPIGGTPMHVDIVSADQFVAAHETTGASAGGLASVVREADDGSWQIVKVRDTSRGADCASYTSASGDRRCVPNEHIGWRTGRYFADSGCTDGVAYDTCETPTIVYSDDPSDCSDSHLFSVAEKIDGPGYMVENGACVPVPWADHTFYRYAAQPLAPFPAIHDVDLGASRVQVRRWGSAGVALSGDGHFVDAGRDCIVRRGDDLRCTPTYEQSAQPSGAFKDAACSVQLLAWGKPPVDGHGVAGGACTAPARSSTRPTIGITSADANGAPEYHELGDEWAGGLYVLDASGCHATTRDPSLHYVVPGPLVDPRSFPLLTELVE